ncbi:ABC transporter substrate-binding protein [Psychrosphaera sp. B3R10]|uniref:ABC transporter substrate-binding protein n=1 Tax=Psychrosphaera algicola TaxID=3023714 RepID=A0ABT5F9Y1_9GAMM|nr:MULTISPECIES: ABC transporter substrate-binding protein [unclassified Psychrosphaera]MBU2881809.1 ABC transporter substrate-binding protein [Psychrosphaera sp. I2R16]MBU2988089.1 ABC transporter substrate-binding protein [Psychrosphaera sp. B3R10]MDC2888206.1 ABC transporter substrate-binding protein [Psychrosphaera sp. G1-22]MDO6721109.1 ABC transporter substrate-binding protein [Psychrosphaera sp. 1_MG-2023]
MLKNLIIAVAILATFSAAAVSKDNNPLSGNEYVLENTKKLAQIDRQGSPYLLVQQLGETLFESVTHIKSINADESAVSTVSMQDLVEEQLMPFIDVTFASYKILGTQLKKSTKEEREMFVNAMQRSLIQTYSGALSQYTNQTVVYEQDKNVDGKKSVNVKAELMSDNGPTLSMIFKLRKGRQSGEWKAYDLIVEGISLVDSKRAELSTPIRQNGIEYVVNTVLN